MLGKCDPGWSAFSCTSAPGCSGGSGADGGMEIGSHGEMGTEMEAWWESSKPRSMERMVLAKLQMVRAEGIGGQEVGKRRPDVEGRRGRVGEAGSTRGTGSSLQHERLERGASALQKAGRLMASGSLCSAVC